MIPAMAPEEVASLMNEIRLWCAAERGRQKALASELGVTEQVISNWLNKRKTPSLSYWLKLQTVAKKIRRRKA
jgi:transcriptional regulator with XRE-family HTH domain